MILAKNPYDRERLTRPEDYSKALYTFDIGQNDLAAGFRKLSIDQLRAALPDIVSQFASALQVRKRELYHFLYVIYYVWVTLIWSYAVYNKGV